MEDRVAAGKPGLTRASDLLRGLTCPIRHYPHGISIRTEKFVPKIVDEGKITIAIRMMNKMKLLL